MWASWHRGYATAARACSKPFPGAVGLSLIIRRTNLALQSAKRHDPQGLVLHTAHRFAITRPWNGGTLPVSLRGGVYKNTGICVIITFVASAMHVVERMGH